jgi:hypothetical protein
MKLIHLPVALATLAMLAGSAAAASYPFTLRNVTNRDVIKVSIPEGKIVGFKRIPAGDSLTFTVEFPDGECIASRVRVKLFGSITVDTGRYNVCSGGGVAITGR